MTLLAVFYRYAVRRLFLQAIRDRIARHEEELQELEIAGAISREDFSFQFLERQFKIKAVLLNVSFSSFLHFLFCEKTPTEQSQDFAKFSAEAGQDAKKVYSEFCKDLVGWMLLSSPVYAIAGSATIAAMIFLFRKKEEREIKTKACEFFGVGAHDCHSPV